jgi:DNA-binding XRE family transcriptional regulator
MSIKEANQVFEKLNGPFSFATYMLGIRINLDLTQVQMAKKLGISKAALCEIEKGRTLVSAQTAVRYARKAGFSETVALEACFQDQLRKAKIKKRVRLEEDAA